jgi:predicted AlkP superfamily phosphohydrolase/phosphomutase
MDDAAVEERGGKIEAAYRRTDDALGEVLDLVGPETVVVVVSDHGAGIKSRGELRFSLDKALREWGLLEFIGDTKEVNWTKTLVYDATKRPYYEKRELFINRRPEGPLGRGEVTESEEAIFGSLSGKLKALQTESGRAIVKKLWMQKSEAEANSIAAILDVDLKAEKVKNEDLDTTDLAWHTNLTGTHRLHGFVAMAGPGIKVNHQIRAASILDVTPTILYLMGLPVAEDQEGRVLMEAIAPALRNARPVETIASYDTGERKKARGEKGSGIDPELLEDLRALGYID